MSQRFEPARARCEALVGKEFQTPKGWRGRFVGVLERPGKPPVVVGKVYGKAWKYTPSKAESLLITEEGK